MTYSNAGGWLFNISGPFACRFAVVPCVSFQVRHVSWVCVQARVQSFCSSSRHIIGAPLGEVKSDIRVQYGKSKTQNSSLINMCHLTIQHKAL